MNLFKLSLSLALVCLVCGALAAAAPDRSSSGSSGSDELDEEADEEQQREPQYSRASVRPKEKLAQVNNLKEVPLAAGKLEGTRGPEYGVPGAAPSAAAAAKTEAEPPKGPLDYAKLMFNPLELVRAISAQFRVPLEGLLDKIGRGYVFGLEATLSPLVSCVKIFEKVFVPDGCKLRFMCKTGAYLGFMREGVGKFSPGFVDGSATIRALAEGIVGKDCELSYPKCEPKLKKAFEALKLPIIGGLLEEKKEAKLEAALTGGAKLADGKQVAADYVHAKAAKPDSDRKGLL